MKKVIFTLAMMSVIFVACTNEEIEFPMLENAKISYVVTPEEAIARLDKVLLGNGTRTRTSLQNVSIKTLKQSDFIATTRSGGADADAPAIYLIDIPDGGCAIMGADKRLEPFYAITDETKLSTDDLISINTRSGADANEDIKDVVTELINNAIEADLMEITTPLKPIPSKLDSLWTETTVYARVQPMLDTKWCQYAPFNNNYPIATRGVGAGQCKDAGCGVIASAQIMYYHKQPNLLNGIEFDWDLIHFYEYGLYNQPLSATIEVANYVYTLADVADVDIYDGYKETSTSKTGIAGLFNTAGYINAMFRTYSLPTIEVMLEQDLPVLIAAEDSSGINQSHMWVIDGCNVYKVEDWVREYAYVDDFHWDYRDYISHSVSYNLLHCNYGYSGRCDGYYSSGIFNTNVELPDGYLDTTVGDIEGTPQGNFSRNIYIMTYSK